MKSEETLQLVYLPCDRAIGPQGLGELYIKPAACTEGCRWDFLGYARGRMYVPNDCDVRLVLTERYSQLSRITAEAADEEGGRRLVEGFRRAFCEAVGNIDPHVRSLVVSGPLDRALMASIGRLSALEELVLNSARDPVSDALVLCLEDAANLRRLSISWSVVTDTALASIGEKRSLRSLDVSHTCIKGEGLEALRHSPLEELDISSLRLSPAGWKNLGGLRSLKRLCWNWAMSRKDALRLAASPDEGHREMIAHDYVWNPAIADEDLAVLTQLTGLESLSLQRAPVTDKGLRHLSGLPKLTSVDLSGTEITDGGVAELARLPHLRDANLSSTNISGKAVAALADVRALAKLVIWNVRLGDEIGPYLAEMQALEELSLLPRDHEILDAYERPEPDRSGRPSRDRVTDVGYACLRCMPSLRKLDLSGLAVTDRTLAYLDGHPNLTELKADHTVVTGEGLGAMPRIRVLSLHRTDLTDRALQTVSTYDSLANLFISNTAVTDAGLASLARLSWLRTLYIGGTKVTDRGIQHLIDMPGVEELGLESLALTDAALLVVAALPRLRELRISSEGYSVSGLLRLGESRSLRSLYVAVRPQEADPTPELRQAMPWCRIIRRG